jgi:hypothetical protein
MRFFTTLLPLSLIFQALLMWPAHGQRARIRSVAVTENLRLAAPRSMEDVLSKRWVGLDFEDDADRRRALDEMRRFLAAKSAGQRGIENFCASSQPQNLTHSLCRLERDRRPAPRAEALDAAQAAAAQVTAPAPHRREAAKLFLTENWSALKDLPYQRLVSAAGAIETPEEVVTASQRALQYLNRNSDCAASRPAAALAYKMEEFFPDPGMVETAIRLYDYAAGCTTDYAGAQAAYRLALLEIMQNRCERVPDLMLKVEGHKEASQFYSRAKYWRAYCAEVLGQSAVSREARQALLLEHPLSFHNLAANGTDERSMTWVAREISPPIAFRSIVRSDLNPLVRATEALIRLQRGDLASELIDKNTASIVGLEPEVRLYLASLMHRSGSALPKFKILTNLFQDVPRMVTGPTMRMFFPLWYFDLIHEQGEHVHPLLVTSLIRQESAFNPLAMSRVGARGLMQVMPSTARMIDAQQSQRLMDPKANIAIGTRYLRKRLGELNGDVEHTLAAYNAGIHRVNAWRKRYPTDNRLLFLDLIPFRETREYVATILRNYFWYTKLYGPQALTQQITAHNLGNIARGQRLPASEAAPVAGSQFTELSADTLASRMRIQRQVEQSMLQITRAQSQAQRAAIIVEH